MLENDDFGDRIVLSDEATFHVTLSDSTEIMFESGVQITLGKSLSIYVRDSPKLNFFVAIRKRMFYEPFFFAEESVRGHWYLDMLQNWSMPQLEEDSQDFIFQQVRAPSRFHPMNISHNVG
ncbi:uncharacterized protein TNCT_471901 [Trichonephila clavata]|uniref:Uncharacterized protein n=1 Tax=Trichonephila clavata TaxID=2740835 RepID=A0A8X6J2R2_TRICU|nr:uncharacterized protein TNCT_471901 [Trichonephila clavata]